METIFRWIPGVGVNEYLFGQQIPNALGFVNTHKITDLGLDEEGSFRFLKEQYVWFNVNVMGVLDYIETWTNLYLGDTNLMGLSREDLLKFFKNETYKYDDSGDCYVIDRLGATFWIEEDVVTGIAVGMVYE